MRKKVSKLHFITSDGNAAAHACMGGADWVQLRLKNVTHKHYRSVAYEVQTICKHSNATLIINDNVALAKEIGADGVHIGKQDMSPDEARALLGPDFIIGCTANTIEDIVLLTGKPVDYIGLGPYRFTTTKENLSPILGLDGYKHIFAVAKEQGIHLLPIIGIGGIQESDVTELMQSGLHGIAVSGAIAQAIDIATATRNFMATVYA